MTQIVDFEYYKNLSLWNVFFKLLKGYPQADDFTLKQLIEKQIEEFENENNQANTRFDTSQVNQRIKDEYNQFINYAELREFVIKLFGIDEDIRDDEFVLNFAYFHRRRLAKIFNILYLAVKKEGMSLEDIEPLEMKFFYPAIELISIIPEIDNDIALQYKWASLLMGGIKRIHSRIFYLHCMKDLNREDIILLTYLWQQHDKSATQIELERLGLTREIVYNFVTIPYNSTFVEDISEESFSMGQGYRIKMSRNGIEFMKLIHLIEPNSLNYENQ